MAGRGSYAYCKARLRILLPCRFRSLHVEAEPGPTNQLAWQLSDQRDERVIAGAAYKVAIGVVTRQLGRSRGTGRLGRVVASDMARVPVLETIGLADIRLSGGQSGVSLSQTAARMIAPTDLKIAKAFSPIAQNHASTVEWRELWWEQSYPLCACPANA